MKILAVVIIGKCLIFSTCVGYALIYPVLGLVVFVAADNTTTEAGFEMTDVPQVPERGTVPHRRTTRTTTTTTAPSSTELPPKATSRRHRRPTATATTETPASTEPPRKATSHRHRRTTASNGAAKNLAGKAVLN